MRNLAAVVLAFAVSTAALAQTRDARWHNQRAPHKLQRYPAGSC
jgi:hypothetical protein